MFVIRVRFCIFVDIYVDGEDWFHWERLLGLNTTLAGDILSRKRV